MKTTNQNTPTRRIDDPCGTGVPRRQEHSRGRRLFLFAVVALSLGGCAIMPQFGHPEPTAVPIESLDRDTLRVEIPDPDTWPIAEESKPVSVEPPKSVPKPKTPATPVVEADTTDVAEPETETPRATPQAITVSPPKAELEQLETEVIADIDTATQLVRGLDGPSLPQSGQDKLETIRSMISQAREALGRQDVQAAAGLARKARLLAVELTSS